MKYFESLLNGISLTFIVFMINQIVRAILFLTGNNDLLDNSLLISLFLYFAIVIVFFTNRILNYEIIFSNKEPSKNQSYLNLFILFIYFCILYFVNSFLIFNNI
jgi:hypothetical protein